MFHLFSENILHKHVAPQHMLFHSF